MQPSPGDRRPQNARVNGVTHIFMRVLEKGLQSQANCSRIGSLSKAPNSVTQEVVEVESKAVGDA